MSWKYISAEEFCDSVRDGTHDTPKPTLSGYKLVTSKHIKNGQIDPLEAYCISEKDYAAINVRSRVEKWDVLLSMIGTVGEAAVVKCDPDYAIKNVALFKCGGSELKGKWLYYYLLSPEAKGKMTGNMKGSSQQFLSLKQLRALSIPVCDDRIMERVVNILSAYDDLIENNRKQIKLLEEAAQRLYKEWFVDLRFPGHEHTKIVDGVPEGWEKSTVSNISSVLRRGISPKYNDQAELMVINQKCIRQTVVTFDEARKQEKSFPEEMNLQDSDTVICSTGAGTLGRVGQIFGNYPQTTFDSHVTLVRAKPDYGTQYLFHFLKSHQEYLMGMGKGSTNQLELSRGTIQDLGILVPTKEIGKEFEMLAQPIHDKISVANAEIRHLQNARDRLLPKLMSGEIEV